MKNTNVLTLIAVYFFFVGSTQAASLIVLDFPGPLNPNTKFNDIFGDHVVGSYTPGSPSRTSGVVYNRSTDTWTTVNVQGARSTTLTGVHGGRAVGNYVTGSGRSGDPLVTRGFIYDISTTTTSLVDLPTGATSMNFTGVFGNVASGSYTSVLGNTAFIYDFVFPNYQSFDYTGDGSTTVGDIFGGMIVGNYSGGGFVYNFSTGTGDGINFPGSGNTTTINGLSTNGNVAGNFSNSNGTFGFYYDGTDPSGPTGYNALNFAGTNSTEAGGVYQDLVVGNFLGADGKVHGFIYDTTPVPEPSIATFLGGFATLLLFRRIRR